LATIRNTIDTQFTSRGGRAVREETESIGRAQTRLGQASAGAGRSFSSQSSGMGGLVGIYAAAAANVFAITAAFEALNAAAKFQTVIRGTEQLAGAVGSTASSVIGNLQAITDGQLSMAEAAKNANLALSAGFDSKQIEELGAVATKASKALGRNLTDAFQRITRGAIKLEPELLDEIGIFTRIEPAVQAYANSIGKSVSQLTNFERRQAFVNQVIEDGNQAFAAIDNSGKSTQKSFEQLVASFSDLAIVAAGFIADSLAPLADFLNKNLGNQLILLGGIGSLVFGKLGLAISGFASGAMAQLSVGLTALSARMAAVGVSATAMATRTAAASTAFTGMGALAGGNAGMGSALKKDLAAGPLSIEQAQSYDPKIKKALLDERKFRKDIRDLQKQGITLTDAQTRAMTRSFGRSRALLMTTRMINDQLKLSGKLANTLAVGIRAAGTAAQFLGKWLNRAFMAVNVLLMAFVAVQAIANAFDIDPFGFFLEMYKDFTAETRQAKIGLAAVNAEIAKGGGVLQQQTSLLDAAGLEEDERTAEGVRGVMETQVEAIQGYQSAMNQIQKQIDKQDNMGGPSQAGAGSFLLGGFFSEDGYNEAVQRVTEFKKLIKDARQAINLLGGAMSNMADLDAFSAMYGKAKEEVDGLTNALARQFNEGNITVQENQTSGGQGSVITTEDVTIKKLKTLQVQYTLTRDAQDKYTEQSKNAITALDKGSESIQKQTDMLKKLEEGNISAEIASRDMTVTLKTVEEALEAAKLLPVDPESIVIVQELTKQLNELKNVTQAVVNRFVAQDALFKKLNKSMSGSLQLLDSMGETGNINAATGAYATSEEEALTFQRENFKLLEARLVKLKDIELQMKRGEEVSAHDRALMAEKGKLEDNLLLIAKDSFAQAVKVLLKSEDQLKAEQKKIDKMQQQLDILKLQSAEATRLSGIRARDALQNKFLSIGADAMGVAPRASSGGKDKTGVPGTNSVVPAATIDARNAFIQSQLDSSSAFERGQAGINLDKQYLASQDAIIAREKKRVDLAKKRVEIENRGLAIQREMRMMAVQAKADSASAAGELAVMRAEEAATIIQERSLSTTKEMADARLKVMEAERDAELATIGGKMAVVKEEFEQAKEVIQEKRDILNTEAENHRLETARLERRRTMELEIVRAEREMIVARKLLEIQKANDEKQAIISRRDIAVKNAENEKTNKLASIALQEKDFELLRMRIEADDDFLIRYAQITEGLANAMGTTYTAPGENPNVKDPTEKALEFIDKMTDPEKGFFAQQRGIIGATASKKTTTAESVATDDEAARLANQQRLEGELESIRHINSLKTLMEDQETTFLEQEAQKQAEMIQLKLDNLDLEDEKAKQAFADKMAALGVEAAVVKEAFRLKKEADEYDLSQKKRMVQLGKDLAHGISDTLGNAMMKFLTNLQEGKPLIEGIGELFTQMLFDIQQKILKASVIDPITDSVTDSLMGSFANMSFFKAAGGVVHMAEGGQVNSLRDRVPAMLEPGEFVIRKSAAKSIGQSRLGQMNSTGAGGMGNVQFNIVNNGAPKEAAQQGPPKIDTDKIVIDVVMRDLNSNGPIRKAMRSG